MSSPKFDSMISALAAENISAYQRVYYNATAGTVAVATATRPANAVAQQTKDAGQAVTCRLIHAGGTQVLLAGGTIAIGDYVYGGAAGVVTTTGASTEVWQALEAATIGGQFEAVYVGFRGPIATTPAVTALTGVATLTAAQIRSGEFTLSHTTGSTVAITTPTGAEMDAAFPEVPIGGLVPNIHHGMRIINLSAAAADTGTLTAGASGVTIVGSVVMPSAHATTGGAISSNASKFIAKRTAANTWVFSRN